MQKDNKLMEKKFRKYVGAKIKLHRENAGLTQKDLAEGIDTSIQQLQNYEYGANNISISKLLSISAFLKKSILDFIPNKLIGGKNSDNNIGRLIEHQNHILFHAKEGVRLMNTMLEEQVILGIDPLNTK